MRWVWPLSDLKLFFVRSSPQSNRNKVGYNIEVTVNRISKEILQVPLSAHTSGDTCKAVVIEVDDGKPHNAMLKMSSYVFFCCQFIC